MTTHTDVLAAIDEFKAAHTTEITDLRKHLAEIEKKANRPKATDASGDATLTPEQAEYRKAFNRYLRKGTDAGLADLQQKAMNSGSDPDGGFLVLPEMDRTIDRIAQTVSPMFRIANVVPVGSQKWEKLVKTSGMAMRRVANGGTGGETTEPKLAKIEIEVFPAEVEPWVHNETLEDAVVNLEADLANEAGIAFSEGGGAEFITGNGGRCARGILDYPIVANAAYAWGSVGYMPSGKSAAFMSVAPADAIINLQHALKTKYRAGATWVMNSATAGVIRKIKDLEGRYIGSDSLLAGQPPILLGSPVEIDDNMPDIGAGSYSL
ncbi:MAG: phage major capsid protein, partial [Ramlibacter sp.]